MPRRRDAVVRGRALRARNADELGVGLGIDQESVPGLERRLEAASVFARADDQLLERARQGKGASLSRRRSLLPRVPGEKARALVRADRGAARSACDQVAAVVLGRVPMRVPRAAVVGADAAEA